MKKLVLVVFMLCLLAIPAIGQTIDSPVTTTWEELEESFIETGYGADFYDINDFGFRILIPNGLEPVELSDEQIKNGFIVDFANEDHSAAVIVVYRDMQCESLEELADYIAENLGEDKIAGYYRMNGLDGLVFVNPENEELVCALKATEGGYFVQVSIQPTSNEELNKLSGFIFGSIQKIEE